MLRPSNCPNPSGCEPILSGFDRTCFGALNEPQPDPDPCEDDTILFNTHCVCMDGQPMEVNDEDAWIFIAGFRTIRQDVYNRQLYRPSGYGDEWDFHREGG